MEPWQLVLVWHRVGLAVASIVDPFLHAQLLQASLVVGLTGGRVNEVVHVKLCAQNEECVGEAFACADSNLTVC